MPRGASAPPMSAPPASGMTGSNTGPAARVGFGAASAETPMPGREKEYEAYQQQVSAMGAAGPAPEIPPIDADRRSRSPGLQNNFYETSTADFKRPHGMPRGASAPPMSAPPASGANMGNAGSPAQMQGGFGAPSAETPMPGREK